MVKVITRGITTLVARRPARTPRHRVVRSVRSLGEVRTHPWFEQRAQRALELGQYR
ncbi:MAG: hypothetical protein KF727_04445 [Microbacteriaceae bacterium]|nr:hypothetical protein [Microbacteriaceae bacterium]